MTFCNAPVMCSVMDAVDPPLPFSESQDGLYSFPVSSRTYLAAEESMNNCSLGFASLPYTPSVFSQQHMRSETRLSYDRCEEPWFSAWIDDDAGTQEPQICGLSESVVVANNALPPADLPANPVLPDEGTTMCLSTSDSSNGSPQWPGDVSGDYNGSVPMNALPLEPEQATTPETKPISTPVRKSKKKRKRVRGPVQCPVCESKFDKPCHLQAHMYDHGDLHKCEDCEQTFAGANHLAIHRKTHEWTPQPCPTCRKEFSKKSSYRAHLKLHDENRQRVKCPHWGCEKDFSQQAVLNRHMSIAQNQAATEAPSLRTPPAAQPTSQKTPRVEVPIHPYTRLPMAPSWEEPTQAWTTAASMGTTQLTHGPLSQAEIYQLDPALLDVQMAMQDQTMSPGYLEYVCFGQVFDQQFETVLDMAMDLDF
ncbi:hypothetical protein H2200_012564 [Cladophialophora chaetospira]|uniref:C2H2-type domain-containing protein n=1 Tax=Cladophialophora chaetospira TaxID=386627 RepID=A0AA38WX68_9EURO|nr:hypothetical protein H2200_012564 [Cladophialophora chaetospira]